MTKNHNVEMISHLFSRCRHSRNRCVQNTSFIEPKCSLWFWVGCWS